MNYRYWGLWLYSWLWGVPTREKNPLPLKWRHWLDRKRLGKMRGTENRFRETPVRHPSQGKRNRRKKPTGSMQEGNPRGWNSREREESPRREETPDGRSPEADVPGEGEEDSSVEEADVEGVDASADSLAEESDSAESDAGGEDADSGESADGLESDGGSEGDSEEPPAEPGPNLIQNPGFEDGADFWGIWGGAQRVEGNAHEGNWAIRATNGNGAEQVVTGLEPNATYRLSGWGKVNGPEPMLVGVKDYGGKQKAIQFKTPEYEEGTLTFNTGFSNTSVVVFAYKHTGGEAGHADSISLQLESLNAKAPVWSDEFNGEGPSTPPNGLLKRDLCGIRKSNGTRVKTRSRRGGTW